MAKQKEIRNGKSRKFDEMFHLVKCKSKAHLINQNRVKEISRKNALQFCTVFRN